MEAVSSSSSTGVREPLLVGDTALSFRATCKGSAEKACSRFGFEPDLLETGPL